ncbi:MAG TPA: HAMP domain-containing protein, partial [Candidatus Goldiibacteriota bacterium]|nr:HAMP domain-containing protein [Candidatus Goldiibacteriota bacterium]
MTKKTTSIKAELIFFIAALVISVVAVSSFLALEAQKRALTAELKLRGQSIARNLANSVADFMLTEDELSVSRIMLEAMNNKGVMYALVVNDKNRIKAHNSVESLGTEYVEPKAVQELESGENRIIITSGAEGERIMDFSYPVMAKGKLKLGVLRLGIDYRVIEDVIRAAYVRAIVIALFALLLGVAGAFILGITITRPVAALARGAREIGKGNLDARISVKSNNELAELAETFNSMAADLKVAQENAIKQQRMEKELEVARDIQLSLIPRNIAEIKGYKINAFYKAAK